MNDIDISVLSSLLASLAAQTRGLESEVTELRSRISGLESEVEDLRSGISGQDYVIRNGLGEVVVVSFTYRGESYEIWDDGTWWQGRWKIHSAWGLDMQFVRSELHKKIDYSLDTKDQNGR